MAEQLPESSGKIAIVNESQLESAQTLTRILRAVAGWMWLLALAVAALAIWLARGRRRLELRALAIGLLVVGLLLLAVQRLAGSYLVDELAKDDAVKPAANEAWSILTQTLADRAWVGITLGLVTLVGVWFVGETRRAGQARRAAAPVFQNRLATYGIAASFCSCSRSSRRSSPRLADGVRPHCARHRRHRGDPKDRPAGTDVQRGSRPTDAKGHRSSATGRRLRVERLG